MHTSVIVVSVLLVVTSIVLLVVAGMRGSKNNATLQHGNIFSFNFPYFKPDPALGGTSSYTSDQAQGYTTGTIQCPVGSEIDIISATYQVYDPYSQCVNQDLCNEQTSGNCIAPIKGIVDFCTTGSTAMFPICRNTYNTSAIDHPSSTALAFANIYCSSTQYSTVDTMPPSGTYSGQGKAACVSSRDATAYLRHALNGQSSKSTLVVPMDNSLITGPLPCIYADVVSGTLLDNYFGLPNTPMVTTSTIKTGIFKPPKQGYVLSGVYACRPTATRTMTPNPFST